MNGKYFSFIAVFQHIVWPKNCQNGFKQIKYFGKIDHIEICPLQKLFLLILKEICTDALCLAFANCSSLWCSLISCYLNSLDYCHRCLLLIFCPTNEEGKNIKKCG
jgi:hypothetical protein